MKTIIGISNFSFEFQIFSSFKEIEGQLAKLTTLKGKFCQYGVSLSLAKDIFKDQFFGLSLETQFNNFSYGRDIQAIIAFRSKLERNYFNGFDKQYTSEELKRLASLSPNEADRICCTLYDPQKVIKGSSSFNTILV